MALAARIEGDLRIAGDLTVDGSMPKIGRTDLTQDALSEFAVPLTDGRVWDALDTLLPVTSANDDIGITGTFGTDSVYLTTGDVKAGGCTRYARFLIRLPAEYDAGETVVLRISGGMKTTVSDGATAVDVQCYKSDRAMGISADICATAAQSIKSLTLADKDFTITPTGLTAGDILDVRITLTVVDAATGTAVIAVIGAIELLCDIKG